MWGKYWNENTWIVGDISAIYHVSRKALEAFEILQVPDESFGMQSMVGSNLLILKTAVHNILAFSTCPKYANTLQIGKSADL